MLYLVALASLFQVWAQSTQPGSIACSFDPSAFAYPPENDSSNPINNASDCAYACINSGKPGDTFSYFNQQDGSTTCYCNSDGPPVDSIAPTVFPGAVCQPAEWSVYFFLGSVDPYTCYPILNPTELSPPLQPFLGTLEFCFQTCSEKNNKILGFQPGSEGFFWCICTDTDPGSSGSNPASNICGQGGYFMLTLSSPSGVGQAPSGGSSSSFLASSLSAPASALAPSSSSSSTNCRTTGCPSGNICANVGHGGGGYICVPSQSPTMSSSTQSASVSSSAADCRSTGCPSGNTCVDVGHGGGGYICVLQSGSSMSSPASSTSIVSTTSTPWTTMSTTPPVSSMSVEMMSMSTWSQPSSIATSASQPASSSSSPPPPSCDCCELEARIKNLTAMVDYLGSKVCNISSALDHWNGTTEDWTRAKGIWGVWW